MTRKQKTWGTTDSPQMCAPSAHHGVRTSIRIFRALTLWVTAGMLLATVAKAQDLEQGRLVPTHETGPVLWVNPESVGKILPGRLSGPIVMQMTGIADTLVTIRSLDPETGERIMQFNDVPDQRYRYRTIKSVALNSDGETVAIGSDSRNDSVPTLGRIRLYDTRSGELLQSVDGNGTRVFALSRQHDRILVWTETDQADVGVVELRTLATYELVVRIPSVRCDRASFDEYTGEIYVSDGRAIHIIRASDGLVLDTYIGPGEMSVARLRGTDTLIAAGSATDEDLCHIALIDLKAQRISFVLPEGSPDRTRFFRDPSFRVETSLDGRTVFISGITAKDPNKPTTRPILSFERGLGIQLYSEGIYQAEELTGDNFGHVGFLPDRSAVLGVWRESPLAPRGLHAYATVPRGTSTEGTAPESQTISMVTDGRMASCSDPSVTIRSIHDMQGRQMPMHCLDEPCTRITVQALPAGSYLVRVLLHGEERSLTLSIVR